MSFTHSILLELFKVALGGGVAALVFVGGQIVQRFIIEPAVEMRKHIGRVGEDLVFYRNCFSAPEIIPPEEWRTATDAHRRHAASLRNLPRAVLFYDRIHRLAGLPSQQKLGEASAALIGISNMAREPKPYDFLWLKDQFTVVHRCLGLTDH